MRRNLPSLIGAALTVGLLLFVRSKVSFQILMADRFIAGAGIIEALVLGAYAAFLIDRMKTVDGARAWRPRIWRLFSIVFFGQLIIGIAGAKIFLMTGNLHLPVPALIIAGPIYRGEGLFMPILFLSTTLLVGPAWCSHLCYIGAADDAAARRLKRPKGEIPYRNIFRIAITVIVPGTAVAFSALGVGPMPAFITAAAFGVIGLLVMLFASTARGAMVHCSLYCPIGLVANSIGKINPFRIKIGEGCTDCGACGRVCRYYALGVENIERRKPGISCTLCGDCLTACRHDSIGYFFPGLSKAAARQLFLIIIITLHASFLGLARM